MTKTEFFAALNLVPDNDVPVVRWSMNPTGIVTASARLDSIGADTAERYEFGIYETVDGETTYTTGRATISAASEVRFDDDHAGLTFEGFAESVRLMVRDEDLDVVTA
jgi:hypothetical protein